VLTPLDDRQAGAIALFQVDGIDNVQLGSWLFSEHRIVNTPIVHPEFKGIRITPNVYTTVDEIDVFSDKVLHAIRRGIPNPKSTS
jgi:selenocysteine lyase/cysteine desulfurase